jgi:hypothetical protein
MTTNRIDELQAAWDRTIAELQAHDPKCGLCFEQQTILAGRCSTGRGLRKKLLQINDEYLRIANATTAEETTR